MTRVAVTGYASLDHVAVLDGVPEPGRTTTILDRPADAWPRLGGSPAYVAAALVSGGVFDTHPVSWVGGDAAGISYREQLAERKIPNDGVEAVAGARTPAAVMAYEPSGGCICLYHPGLPADLSLSQAQRRLVAAADWLCITIGPPGATAAALDVVDPKAKVAWVVKHDPRSLPPELAARLAGSADLICYSAAERSFVEAATLKSGRSSPGQLLIETRGRSGAVVRVDGSERFITAEPVTASDPTGAGDTFAGGVLAAIVKGEPDIVAAVEAGHRAASALLKGRAKSKSGSAEP
jgi:ribokinase